MHTRFHHRGTEITEGDGGFRHMYIRANQQARSDADVIEVIERNMFATLVTGTIASHLPFLLEDGVLYAHMARANPHAAVVGTSESLVIFTGPHAYISPS